MEQTKLSLKSLAPKALLARRLPPGDLRHLHINRRVRLAFRKREQMPVSVWAEKFRVVPADSPVPGYWQNKTTPYLTGIMDAVMADSVQEAVICAPPQTGKTDLALNLVGYTVDRKPGNWMIVYPDEKSAADMSRDRIQPMFQDSPRLRRYLTQSVDDLSSLRITLKHCRLYLAWASSAPRLASRPLPFVLLDEVDKFPATVGKKESGPVDLARKRTRTFGHMRKIIRVSTPTIETGPIWQALENECDAVFVYWVRCQQCGAYQLMAFEQIKWEGGGAADPREIQRDARSSWYECKVCDQKWNDATRDEAVAAGEWRDRNSGLALQTVLESLRPVVIGFHFQAWISRFVPLREAAAAFLRAQTDINKLKDFRNDYCAEPWRVVRQERQTDRIMALVEDRPRGLVPGPGLVSGLTAGVDTQDQGFWFWIHAWGYATPGARPSSWVVRAGFVETFEALADVLWNSEYVDLAGNQYVIELAIQDSAGHRTAQVYDFARLYRGRVVPAIGKQTLSAPYRFSSQSHYPGAKRLIPGGLNLLVVNSKYFKDEVAAALQVQPGDPGCIGLYFNFPDDYAQQLCAEFVNDSAVWECPAGRANHLWDCLVLAFVAAEIRGVRFRAKPGENRPAAPIKIEKFVHERKRW